MITNVADTTKRRNGAEPPRAMRRREMNRVIEQIEHLCDAFGVGARIPAHRDLMTRFETTERTVLGALAELQRRGRIVRRAGSGTYVASAMTAVSEAVSEEPAAGQMSVGNIIVVGSHDQGYYSRAIEMAFRHAQEHDLGVSYEPPNFERLMAMPRMQDGTAYGFIILGSLHIYNAKALSEAGHRVVGIGDRGLGHWNAFPCVHPDNTVGGYLAASHLIEYGHRRIGYLAAGSNPRLWGHEQAVRQAQEAGQDVQSIMIGRDTFNEWQKDPSLGEAFFAAPDRPTGFCAWNDTDAIRLMTFLMSVGLRVPSDVSIVGYDNLPVGETISPALSTVETRLDDQVKLALNLLTSPSGLPRHSVVVEPELVVRSSTQVRA